MSQAIHKDPPSPPRELFPTREIGALVAIVGVLVGMGYLLWRGGNAKPAGPAPDRLVNVKLLTDIDRSVCGEPTRTGIPHVISMVYSDDKRRWIEDAAEQFSDLCPNIQVKLDPREDLEAADVILLGEVKPTLWAPADELALRYIDHHWKHQSKDVLFRIEDQISLARSPLIALVWEDRMRVLDAIRDAQAKGGPRVPWHGPGPWAEMACALVPEEPEPFYVALEDRVPGRWIDWYEPLIPPPAPPVKPARGARKPPPPPPPVEVEYTPEFPTVNEIQRWGRVKFGHTSPTRSTSGLEALYLMAYDYVMPPDRRPPLADETARGIGLTGADAERFIISGEHLRLEFTQSLAERDEDLRNWLGRCEGGLENPLWSARLLTETMFNVGGGRFDGILTYEHLVFSVLKRIDDHARVMRTMRVIYPQPTIVNQHPVVMLWPDDPALGVQREAAERWISFLRSRPIQEKAIEYGFRPASPEVSIRAFDSYTNPFVHLRRYGISFQVPLEEPPRLDGPGIQGLIGLWEDATGRN
ncbi:substrate-binding domain-containing protein [Chondromyces crocatus]|uniref:Extracellular solute-binding protein n=1 Tax=Chondromyces crocatus TaxID=52 RepID=A0A0K1ERJ4_CHOCO|nr:substrate-binding domain-containing protein [Chondromyces crocatus]AKT43461.1 uncharacterized protein CMC5_076930 [Chondromyces crocatus]